MTISSIVGKYAVKAAGLAGLGILAYDAHKRGVRKGEMNRNKKDFQALDYFYENSRNLPTASHVNMKLKDGLFKWELRNDFRGFINNGIGYIKGFASMVTDDIVPWALSIAAIGIKGSKKIPCPTLTNPHATKTVMSTPSKVAGIALGAYALYAFAKNVCGLGVSSRTK